MSIFVRIISGDTLRRSRFHDEKGNRVSVHSAVCHAPLALLTAVLKRLTGWRPILPMISFAAARQISGLLRPESQVIEFGSGMSTPWLAARCGRLISIEDDPGWYSRVSGLLSRRNVVNVRHEMRDRGNYANLSDLPDGSLDFALVDGTDRAGCIRAVAPKIRAGGWIYLDNSDKDMNRPDGDLRRAEKILREIVISRKGTIQAFTDFSPTNFFAEQGLLAQLN